MTDQPPVPPAEELSQPWSFGQARRKCGLAERAQENAEQALRDAYVRKADAESEYRLALAKEIIAQHDEEGVAWTAAESLARGNEEVADLRHARDISEGAVEAAQQALWRHVANRKDAQRFADWSQRRELAEAAGQVPEPAGDVPIGAGH